MCTESNLFNAPMGVFLAVCESDCLTDLLKTTYCRAGSLPKNKMKTKNDIVNTAAKAVPREIISLSS